MRRALLGLVLCACGGGNASPPDAVPLPAWQRELPAASVMGTSRGLVAARGIIHLHSPYSHDACDGNPRGDTEVGPIDEDCYQDLRDGLCATRQDYAALTDHDDSMAGEEFTTLLLQRGSDELVGAGASRIHCDNGHEVLLTVGGENPIMPIMLDQHVAGDVQQRHDTYNGDDPAAVAAFRAAGATIWIPHTEQRTADAIEALAPDGIEIYQLHANLAPDLREMYLGLDPSGAITAVADFANTSLERPAEPDLALISFVEPNTPSLEVWDTLLGRGVHLSGSGGSDAHQNALPLLFSDGERGDSYRRVMRWFDNVALVADPSDPALIEAALRGGRMFAVFEIMGTPVGFDAHAGTAELGDTVLVSAGATFEVTLPTVHELDADLPEPVITAKVIRVTAAGSTVVAEGAGPTLSVPLDTAGAYRVEVHIQPRHLGPYLGDIESKGYAERVLPWIYASPIYVE